MKTKRIIVQLIALLFLLLFAYTAMVKWGDFSNFVKGLERYTPFKPYAGHIAQLVIGSEVIISLLLLFARTRLLGLYASLLIMLAFTGALYYIIYGLQSSYCNCGGFIDILSASQHLWFNWTLIVLAVIGMYWRRNLNFF
ncbi:MauE/DoxX family redox-associated membrane protein [Sphingobacterium faecale]|uniref:Methylamine utilisation protein MauE domain-containing protein n=1 Tax=Sphingobacterium faecale TaxID=2803775 RepID=A0ABS1R4B9_9SPHI|nr:MauE/DoxX family redox-associated membrane protein [Sphingobacterium faecale]MBL1408686.1 hypothetical protein [Sphingobacterium faecale]